MKNLLDADENYRGGGYTTKTGGIGYKMAHKQFCNSPCPTKAVISAGEKEAGPLLDKEARQLLKEVLVEDYSPSTPKHFKGWVAGILGDKENLTDKDIRGMKKDFDNEEIAWMPSTSSLAKLQKLQSMGMTRERWDVLNDHLSPTYKGKKRLNKDLNTAAVNLRLEGMYKAGWRNPRYTRDGAYLWNMNDVVRNARGEDV